MRLIPNLSNFYHLLPNVHIATHLHDHLHYFGIVHPRLYHTGCFTLGLVRISTSTVSVAINSC